MIFNSVGNHAEKWHVFLDLTSNNKYKTSSAFKDVPLMNTNRSDRFLNLRCFGQIMESMSKIVFGDFENLLARNQRLCLLGGHRGD